MVLKAGFKGVPFVGSSDGSDTGEVLRSDYRSQLDELLSADHDRMNTQEFSRDFALVLLQALGVGSEATKTFRSGSVPRTFYFPSHCREDRATVADKQVIDDMREAGMLAYYVIRRFVEAEGTLVAVDSYLYVLMGVDWMVKLSKLNEAFAHLEPVQAFRIYLKASVESAMSGRAFSLYQLEGEGVCGVVSERLTVENGMLVPVGDFVARNYKM